ncbi:MAG: PfkB family carbohydrate kinase [Bdellovibrionales bacterium]
MSEILVVGSVAYDSIGTPAGKVESTLGGSANYFATAASLYAQVNVVGVVGEDYRSEDLQILRDRKVNLDGLKQVPGKTFRWTGRYEGGMNEAITMDTQLNVFANFSPQLPSAYKHSPYVFLANIDPELQLNVLEQIERPKLVGADTMNYWIDSKLEGLKRLLKRIDFLLINEGELRRLTGDWNTIAAVKKVVNMGPKAVVIKRGEYGFVMYTENRFFILPAFPVENVIDPTGAGDTFAGGVFGYLAKTGESLSYANLRQACVHGCLMASFTVQDFGLMALRNVNWADVEKRQSQYLEIISYSI